MDQSVRQDRKLAKVYSNIKDKTIDKISLSGMKKGPDIFVHLSFGGWEERCWDRWFTFLLNYEW